MENRFGETQGYINQVCWCNARLSTYKYIERAQSLILYCLYNVYIFFIYTLYCY
ncbi:unnamed protein product [Acanthoscelides obtectus]|uniref:Uncharacterized protein n=1 Tax=Acanthoscelides obtectus TaxID=200917 RepID=A0A9P0KSR7_ACAOB|nr:unnamed protein product [Acanthoscelides obtectus]CAK1657738.1 hypothetical protein AOBTE_LOCUS20507 [Acanthoscelides obtectus]